MGFLNSLQKWISKNSQASRFTLGRVRLRERNFTEAERHLEPFLSEQPAACGISSREFGEILVALGQFAFETNRHNRARNLWRRVFDLELWLPTTGQAMSGIGAIECAADRVAQAIQTFERAIKIDQDANHPQAAARSMIFAAEHLRQAGALDDALKFSRRAADLLETTRSDELVLGQCLVGRAFIHQDLCEWPQASEVISKAIQVLSQMNPPDLSAVARAHLLLARQHELCGQYDLCLSTLDQMEPWAGKLPAEQSYACEIANLRGGVAQDRWQYDQALTHFKNSLKQARRARQASAHMAIFLNNIAYALIKTNNQLKKAEDLLFKAFPLIADHAANRCFINTLGTLAQANGETDWADSLYRLALDLSKTSLDRRTQWISLAELYQDTGHFTESTAAYENALREFDTLSDHPMRMAIAEKLSRNVIPIPDVDQRLPR